MPKSVLTIDLYAVSNTAYTLTFINNYCIMSSFKSKEVFIWFGVDWLAFNVFKRSEPVSENCRFFGWLDGLFKKSHNNTNAKAYSEVDFPYSRKGAVFVVHYLSSPMGEMAQFQLDGQTMFEVTKIDSGCGMGNISDFMFRFDFTGQFFAFGRLGEIDARDIIFSIANERVRDNFPFSLSRVDLAMDLKDVSVLDVYGGFSSVLDIPVSKLNSDSTGPQTVYIGGCGGKRAVAKKVRIYNKFLDLEAKGKKRWFLDYYQNKSVTRVELELHGAVLKRLSGFGLRSVFNLEACFGVYRRFLNDRFSSYSFLPLAERQFRERGFAPFVVDLAKVDLTNIMHVSEYVKRLLSVSWTVLRTYGVDPRLVIESDKSLMDSIKAVRKRQDEERLVHMARAVLSSCVPSDGCLEEVPFVL